MALGRVHTDLSKYDSIPSPDLISYVSIAACMGITNDQCHRPHQHAQKPNEYNCRQSNGMRRVERTAMRKLSLASLHQQDCRDIISAQLYFL